MTRTLALLACSAAMISGCARTVIVEPQETSYDPNDTTAQLDFWHELPGRSAISNNEGVHGIILLMEGTDTSGSYENRLAYLDERGWLPPSLKEEDANVAMQRGMLAAILVRALEIDGGVMMQLTGRAPRYAYREMVYLDLMPPGSEQMVVDGLDFLGVISECEDYRRAQAMEAQRDAEPEQLPEELAPESPEETAREAREAT